MFILLTGRLKFEEFTSYVFWRSDAKHARAHNFFKEINQALDFLLLAFLELLGKLVHQFLQFKDQVKM